jgi:hypothetical protein
VNAFDAEAARRFTPGGFFCGFMKAAIGIALMACAVLLFWLADSPDEENRYQETTINRVRATMRDPDARIENVVFRPLPRRRSRWTLLRVRIRNTVAGHLCAAAAVHLLFWSDLMLNTSPPGSRVEARRCPPRNTL